MAQTKVFDNVLSDSFMNEPFSFSDLLSKLKECEDWFSNDVYAKSCLRDRIKKGVIIELSTDYFQWNSNFELRRNQQNMTVKKKNRNMDLLAQLTSAESAKVEEEIRNDRRYPQKVRDVFRRIFGVVPPFIPSQLGNIDCKKLYYYFTHETIFEIVKQISIDNKIQYSKVSQYVIFTDFIQNPSNDFFCRILHGDLTLIEEMNDFIKNTGHLRYEWSLTTKICKGFNQLLFGLDDYYIYDQVVNSHLDQYRLQYGLPAMKKTYYENYWHSLEDLRVRVCPTLTRNELDHIIWYRNK